MKRAMFIRGRREPVSLGVPAFGIAARARTLFFGLALIWMGAGALSGTALAGGLGPDGKDGQERLPSTTARRERTAIVIASARTAGAEMARETRAFTLAEDTGRDTRDAEATEGADGTSAPRASRWVLTFPQVVAGLRRGTPGRADRKEEEAWPAAAFREAGRELPPLGFENGPSGPPAVALSVFMGRKNGDVFSSLHEEYAWRMKFKTMTLGLGFYREIVVGERARILPYIGVIRSSLSLRPAGLASEQLLHEYQMTVFCFGLPLVIGF